MGGNVIKKTDVAEKYLKSGELRSRRLVCEVSFCLALHSAKVIY